MLTTAIVATLAMLTTAMLTTAMLTAAMLAAAMLTAAMLTTAMLAAAQGGVLLASALQSNSRLTELDLANNQIGPVAGAKVLAAVADEGGMRRTLRTLKMGGNTLTLTLTLTLNP